MFAPHSRWFFEFLPSLVLHNGLRKLCHECSTVISQIPSQMETRNAEPQSRGLSQVLGISISISYHSPTKNYTLYFSLSFFYTSDKNTARVVVVVVVVVDFHLFVFHFHFFTPILMTRDGGQWSFCFFRCYPYFRGSICFSDNL